MISFVYLRNANSRTLQNEHVEQGYHVHEAFTTSEAVWICTQNHLGMIVIADNIECSEVSQLKDHHAIFCLKAHTTMNELICHLSAA
jgi:hypothetical protein